MHSDVQNCEISAVLPTPAPIRLKRIKKNKNKKNNKYLMNKKPITVGYEINEW